MEQVQADMKKEVFIGRAMRILLFPPVLATLSCKTTLMKRARALATSVPRYGMKPLAAEKHPQEESRISEWCQSREVGAQIKSYLRWRSWRRGARATVAACRLNSQRCQTWLCVCTAAERLTLGSMGGDCVSCALTLCRFGGSQSQTHYRPQKHTCPEIQEVNQAAGRCSASVQFMFGSG